MSTAPSLPCCYLDSEAPTVVETYETTSPEWDFEYHSHADADWEIQYIARGRASIVVDDAPCTLGAGEILILRPDQPHGCDESLGRRRVVTFREEALGSLPCRARGEKRGRLRIEDRRLPAHFAVPRASRAGMERLVAQLQEESSACQPLSPAMCNALLAQLLLVLARQASTELPVPVVISPAAQENIEQFCAEVRASLDHRWTLDEMVRRSGYSAPQLCRLFGLVTSLSPCRWLREERVRGARELLIATDKTMAEIAVEVGFDSRSQLHRVFRELTGLSPNEYREYMRS